MKLFENENLFKKMVEQYGFNLFLGAGFSVYAQNADKVSLPLGNKINEELKKVFNVVSKRKLDLSKTCQKIRATNSDALDLFLRNTYLVKEFNEDYLKLNRFPIKNIITTNIDDLVEKIYNHPDSKMDLSDVQINGYVEKNNIVNLYKLHGSVTYPIGSRLSFTEKELSDLFLIDNNLFQVVSYKLSSAPCIFLGNSLNDSNSIQLLCKSEKFNKVIMPKWIVVYPLEGYEELIDDYHELGFHIIVGDTIELINYIGEMEFVNLKPDDRYIYRKYRDSFPNNFICKELIRKSPVRPVTDFFYGAEPQISDVLSNNIIRTSYFNHVFSSLLNNDITLITGIPGCGKSTLLLQLAFAKEINGRKFWFNNMIVPEAERLCSLIKDDNNAIIFLDNLYNNLDAFSVLKKSKNIKIVTAERGINYEFVKKTLSIKRDSIIDISDLSQLDIQNICQSMNKSSYEAINMMKRKNNISLLEIVFFAFHSITVKERIAQYIATLKNFHDEKLKIDLLELYALVNYISYCGIPASMDMLIFYFGNSVDNYEDILYAVAKMNNILVEAEIEDKPDLNDQDYLTMRSKLYAELSMSKLPSAVLKKVLVDFQKNINPFIIYRYDIFKKKAYDADITKKAFNHEEGIAFYESLIKTNSNPYIRHQYALFLQRTGDIDGAWLQIDQAYTDSHRRIFTIANTHAMIMFEKNIVVTPSNNSELIQLKQIIGRTFETLEYCIDKDLRVNYHVLIYARNTIRYFDKFGLDDNSKRYILTASNELEKITTSDEFIYRRLFRELKSLYKDLLTLKKLNNL
jgi:hypothetical protein